MGEWFDLLTHWLAQNPQWMGLVVFLASFTECLAIVGLLVPGTLLLFTLAVLAGNNVLDLSSTIFWGFLGGLLGDILSYLIGRYYHQGIRELPLLRDRPEWLAVAEQYFQRYGIFSLLVGRFIGPVRPFLPLTAGMLDMPPWRFVLVSIPASLGWAVVYLVPGWTTGAALRLPLPEHFWFQTALVAGGLATVLAALFYLSLRNPRYSHWMMAGLCFLCLAALSLFWPQMQALDRGLVNLLQQVREPLVDQLMVFITRFGDLSIQTAVGILLVLLLLGAGYRQHAGFTLGTLLGTALCSTALKEGFARLRPEVLIEPLNSHSYPSAHSSAAFALFLVFGILASRQQVLRMRLAWLLVACIPAAAIAISRLYLGVHWPTDILAGGLVAASCCTLSLAVAERKTPLAALPSQHRAVGLMACLGLLLVYGGWELPEALQRYDY